MRHALWLGILGICATARVGATTPTQPPHEQEQHQNQSASAAQTQSANADADATSSAQSNANGTINSSVTSRSVGLAHGAPMPASCPAGLVPGRGKHRAHGSPLYSVSAVCDAPDDEQAAAIAAHREHEARLATIAADALRAEAERERAATERILALAQACREYAERVHEACVSK